MKLYLTAIGGALALSACATSTTIEQRIATACAEQYPAERQGTCISNSMEAHSQSRLARIQYAQARQNEMDQSEELEAQSGRR
ncbi:MAG: hypothetical protein P8H62_13045 [Henriciella sp.]|nr:hypothetical protein [Henriciella sp.]